MRLTCFLVLVLMATSAGGVDLPLKHAGKSEYFIDYSDIDLLLGGSVIDYGPSTHKPPILRKIASTGSRIQVGNTSITRQEGNRVLLHAFEEPERRFLSYVRADLLSIPTKIPFEFLTSNEQLAYWLNLHNVIVLAEVAERYPITMLDAMFDTGDPNAFINQRKFDFDGQMISLADIQRHVLTNWNDPLVIYGFYMGAVGTPNLRTEAFSGTSVLKQLTENATDFVNSLRGTQIWKESELKISTYYQRMAVVFPDFETSVRAHLEKYAKGDFKRRLYATSTLTVELEDWHIADLYNGRPFSEPGGRFPKITKDANDVSYKLRIPPHVVQLLRDRERKLYRLFRDSGGTIDVEELPKPDEQEPKK